jgi:hypothetical protein
MRILASIRQDSGEYNLQSGDYWSPILINCQNLFNRKNAEKKNKIFALFAFFAVKN